MYIITPRASIMYNKLMCNKPLTIQLSWGKHILKAMGYLYGSLRNLHVFYKLIPQNIRRLIAKSCLIPALFYEIELWGF